MIFDGSTIYKLYYLDDFKLAKTFTVSPSGNLPAQIPFGQPQKQGQQKVVDAVELDIQCQSAVKGIK